MGTVFVSYSHHDQAEVGQIVQLLRTALLAVVPSTGAAPKDLVFLDKECLLPGSHWSACIDGAILEASLVLVFWCRHSAESAEVRREYLRALSLDRVTVPVLVDQTPMPQELAPIHGVDLRALRMHGPRVRGFAPGHARESAVRRVLREFAPVLRVEPDLLIGAALRAGLL